MRTLLLAALIPTVCAVQPTLSQQPPRSSPSNGPAVIRGRVVAADNGAPLRRAQIRVVGSAAPEGRTVLTDSEGQYEVAGISSGSLTVTASKTGYVEISHGQRRPGEPGRPVTVASGAPATDIDFALVRAGVIVARITNDRNDPIPDMPVHVFQLRFRNGERTPVNVSRPYFVTDDLGEARIHGLAAGDYYVAAGTGDAVMVSVDRGIGAASGGRVYIDTYYPGTSSSAEAQRIPVTAGQEISVTFPLVASRLVRVSGIVRSHAGTPPSQLSAWLGRVVTDSGASGWRDIPLGPDGTFSIDRVVPGRYSIQVDREGTPNSPEKAMHPIVVGERGLTGVVVETDSGGILRGRYVFDDGPPPAGVRPGAFRLNPAIVPELSGWSGRQVRVDGDWTFEHVGLLGRGVLRLAGPTGWFLKSITIDGKDVTDQPVEFSSDRPLNDVQVVVTQKQAILTGTAMGERGEAVTDFYAVVFPDDAPRWTPQTARIAAARADGQGRVRIAGLPAGRFHVAAVDYLNPGDERDPELLRRLVAGAETVTLALGEERPVSLKLQKLP